MLPPPPSPQPKRLVQSSQLTSNHRLNESSQSPQGVVDNGTHPEKEQISQDLGDRSTTVLDNANFLMPPSAFTVISTDRQGGASHNTNDDPTRTRRTDQSDLQGFSTLPGSSRLSDTVPVVGLSSPSRMPYGTDNLVSGATGTAASGDYHLLSPDAFKSKDPSKDNYELDTSDHEEGTEDETSDVMEGHEDIYKEILELKNQLLQYQQDKQKLK